MTDMREREREREIIRLIVVSLGGKSSTLFIVVTLDFPFFIQLSDFFQG